MAADRLVAALRREKRVPIEGPRAWLAQDFLSVATLLDRSGIGLKPGWQGERTTQEAHAILQRAYYAMGADLQGLEHDDWETDAEIAALLKWIRPSGNLYRSRRE